MMVVLAENRWKRFGHDRVYVETDAGDPVGFVDLKNQSVHAEVEGFEDALRDCLDRWVAQLDPDCPQESPALSEPPSSGPSHDISSIPEATDLAANSAGQSAQAERDRINSEAPVRNFVARLFGAKTEERNWRVGADGERRVGRELSKLGQEWNCLHSVNVGNRGSDIDHLLIGPPGLVTLNTKCHPEGSVWVGERMVMVNGHKTQYLRNSRHEAERAQRLLADATGWTVPVTAGIVMVQLDKLSIKQMPDDVEVVSRRKVVRWLDGLPGQLTPGQVESVFATARLSTTWSQLA